MSDTLSFEKSIEALEAIVKELENGELALDEAVKKYQDGLALAKRCHTMLVEAEKVLTNVVEKEEEKPFELEEQE